MRYPVLLGSGIVPFTRVNDEILFIFGKERFVENWQGSHKWSGFEGSCHEFENSIDTACREFDEETLMALPFDMLYNDLVNNRYNLKITTSSRTNKQHITYVKFIPASDSLVRCVRTFEKIRQKISYVYQKRERVLETEALIREFNSMQSSQSILMMPGVTFRMLDATFVVTQVIDVRFYKYLMFSRIMCARTDRAAASTLGGLSSSSGIPILKEVSYDTRTIPNEVTLAYTQWSESRMQLTTVCRDLMTLSKNVFSDLRFTEDNMFVSHVAFNDSYMEKEMILFWSLEELVRVVSTGDLSMFRTNFHAILHAIVHEFSLNDVSSLKPISRGYRYKIEPWHTAMRSGFLRI